MQNQINNCCNQNNNEKTITPGYTLTAELDNKREIILNQNMPNPFAESTTITFSIPEGINSAKIVFAEVNGTILKTIDIKERGYGEVKVYAANLSSGNYIYYLLINGEVKETKQMNCVK